MTARAHMRTADWNRLLKAAKTHGFAVEYDGDKVRLLPTQAGAELPSANDAEEEWDKVLGLQ